MSGLIMEGMYVTQTMKPTLAITLLTLSVGVFLIPMPKVGGQVPVQMPMPVLTNKAWMWDADTTIPLNLSGVYVQTPMPPRIQVLEARVAELESNLKAMVELEKKQQVVDESLQRCIMNLALTGLNLDDRISKLEKRK